MKKGFVRDVAIWFFLWIVLWGGFLIVRYQGITHTANPFITSFYFLFASLIVIFTFRKHFHPFVKKFTVVPFIVLVVVLVASVLVYIYANTHLTNPNIDVGNDLATEFIEMKYPYLLSKAFEILFQQTLIVLLVSFFIELKMPLKRAILTFVALFGAAHVAALLIHGGVFGTYFLVFSIIGAFVFPELIERVNYGFVYAYIIHYGFYIVSGLAIWMLF